MVLVYGPPRARLWVSRAARVWPADLLPPELREALPDQSLVGAQLCGGLTDALVVRWRDVAARDRVAVLVAPQLNRFQLEREFFAALDVSLLGGFRKADPGVLVDPEFDFGVRGRPE